MTSRNDVTGDKIQTKGTLSKEGRDNWDRIFGKKDHTKGSKDPDPAFKDELNKLTRKPIDNE